MNELVKKEHGNKGRSMAWLAPDKNYSGKDKSNNLEPKNPKTKALYFEIYEWYVMTHSTIAAVAKKFERHPDHIGRVIKYVTRVTDNGDRAVYEQMTVDKLGLVLQDLERKLLALEPEPLTEGEEQEKVSMKEQQFKFKQYIELRKEFRQTIKLIAQARKILAPDMMVANIAPVIEVKLPNIGRGEGAIEKEEIIIEQKVE